MSDKVFVGRRAVSADSSPAFDAYSKVVIIAGENEDGTQLTYEAGDDTGRTLEIQNPWGTLQIADDILSRVKGYAYQPFTASGALVDPAAELGDGVTVDGLYSVLAAQDIRFGPLMSSDISAPSAGEIESEYPYVSKAAREIARRISNTRTSLIVDINGVKALVENLADGVDTSFSVLDGKIEGKISSADAESLISQSIGAITISVENGSGYSKITLKDEDGVVIATSGDITLGGDVVFTSDLTDGTTIISGNNIQTGRIDGDLLKAGSVYADTLHLGGDLTVYRTLSGNTVGGSLGYKASLNDGSAGIHMASSSGYGEAAVTNNGARISYSEGDWDDWHAQVTATDGACGMEVTDRYGSVRGVELKSGAFYPYPSNTLMLGKSGYVWNSVYAYNSTIYTSDERAKEDIEALPEKYVDMFDRLTPRRFRMREGTSGRYHVGYIAQEVKAAMDAAGIAPAEFGGWVLDRDEDGNELQMLRYGEFDAVYAAKLKQLEARVAALENRIAKEATTHGG